QKEKSIRDCLQLSPYRLPNSPNTIATNPLRTTTIIVHRRPHSSSTFPGQGDPGSGPRRSRKQNNDIVQRNPLNLSLEILDMCLRWDDDSIIAIFLTLVFLRFNTAVDSDIFVFVKYNGLNEVYNSPK
ncbi:hypothetical protein AKJ16_DCAP27243, partial [Drosera capensis]